MYWKQFYRFDTQQKELLKGIIESFFHNSKIICILYWSTLSGYLLPWSDIDLIVVQNGAYNTTTAIHALKRLLYKEFDCPIDISVIDADEYSRLQENFLNGIVYEIL